MYRRLIQAIIGLVLGSAIGGLITAPSQALIWIDPGVLAAIPAWACETADGTASKDFTVDVGRGPNRKLLVWVFLRGNSTSCPGSGGTRPSGTYKSLTLVNIHVDQDWETTSNTGTGRICVQSMYYDLTSTETGANTLHVEWGNTASTTPITAVVLAAVVVDATTGSSLSGDDDAANSGRTSSSFVNLTIDSGADVWASFATMSNVAAFTLGSGQTFVDLGQADGAGPTCSSGNKVCVCDSAGSPISVAMTYEAFPGGGAEAATFSWSGSAGVVGNQFEL